MDDNQAMVLLLSHKWNPLASKTSQSSLGASCCTSVPDLVSSPCLKGYNMSRFRWKCTDFQSLALQNSSLQSNKAPLELLHDFMSVFRWTLGIFTPFQKHWSWTYLVGIPGGGWERRGWGRGKTNPETSCSFVTPVCPVGQASSSILYSFCGQCAPKSITNISVPHLWNELIMQTSRYPAIATWYAYSGQTPWPSQKGKGCGEGWGCMRQSNYL